MKKLFTILLAVALCVPIAIFSASCGNDKKAQLQSISVDTTNAKTSYYVGDDFSSTGLVVKAKYSDETEKTLASSEYTINSSAYKKAEVGTYEIVVTYQEKTAKYTVTVEETPLALAKKCLEAWEEEGYWINTVYQTTEWYKDSQKVGDSQIFSSYGLQYSKFVDYSDGKDFLTSIKEAECEQWLIPSDDDGVGNVTYTGYDLETSTKKTYNTLAEALQDYNFGNMENKYFVNKNGREGFALYLSIKDPSIQVDPELNLEHPENFEVNIEVSDTEIKVIVSMKGSEQNTIWTFDKETFVLKSFGDTNRSAILDEEGKYDYYNSIYYFNTTPSQRMKTPPTIDWTSAN